MRQSSIIKIIKLFVMQFLVFIKLFLLTGCLLNQRGCDFEPKYTYVEFSVILNNDTSEVIDTTFYRYNGGFKKPNTLDPLTYNLLPGEKRQIKFIMDVESNLDYHSDNGMIKAHVDFHLIGPDEKYFSEIKAWSLEIMETINISEYLLIEHYPG